MLQRAEQALQLVFFGMWLTLIHSLDDGFGQEHDIVDGGCVICSE